MDSAIVNMAETFHDPHDPHDPPKKKPGCLRRFWNWSTKIPDDVKFLDQFKDAIAMYWIVLIVGIIGIIMSMLFVDFLDKGALYLIAVVLGYFLGLGMAFTWFLAQRSRGLVLTKGDCFIWDDRWGSIMAYRVMDTKDQPMAQLKFLPIDEAQWYHYQREKSDHIEPQDPSFCPMCRGHGTVPVIPETEDDPGIQGCPRCDGTGFRSADEYNESLGD